MSGNTNQQALAVASQALHATSQTNGDANSAGGIHQSRMCSECWIYWKKFGSFKFPSAREERLNRLRNQVHKCSVNGCGREFKLKQLLVKHCGIAHGYFVKINTPPAATANGRVPINRNRTSFYLLTTPMSQAARIVCVNSVKLKKLGRKPFKLVELAELNKEWTKEPNRNIQQIIDDNKKKEYAQVKLSKELINKISKNRVKLTKKGNDDEEDEDDEDNLVIDSDHSKPDFLKYFEKKCEKPCYTPEQLLFPKLDAAELDKFHLNLMSQNRKRSHDQAKLAGDGKSDNGKGSDSNIDLTSPPQSKKFISNETTRQHPKMPSKSVKPAKMAADAPEEIFYICNKTLK
jgi:hypothetical protein